MVLVVVLFGKTYLNIEKLTTFIDFITVVVYYVDVNEYRDAKGVCFYAE